MRRVLVMVFLFWAVQPMVLFGLETVNLIKDASFEKESEVWQRRFVQQGEFDIELINSHDTDSAFVGSYCGSIDTRPFPDPSPVIRGEMYQILDYPKKLSDLDSLVLYHMSVYGDQGNKISTWGYGLRMLFLPGNDDLIEAYYLWLAPDLDPMDDEPSIKVFPDTIFDEGEWNILDRNLQEDLIISKGLSDTIELDTFILYGSGLLYLTWRSQKAFFDGIRLMGWADYNIALPRFTGTLEQPTAMVWNNGREDQTDVIVIATIEGGAEPYADTVILPTLVSDDSTEVTFAEFGPVSPSDNYCLTIATGGAVGMLDECDEDDILYEEYLGVTESVTHHQGLNLEVFNAPGGVLKVTFKTPERQIGNLTLFDASGRRIERMAVTQSGTAEFGGLPSGTYFVKLCTERSQIIIKVVVLR